MNPILATVIAAVSALASLTVVGAYLRSRKLAVIDAGKREQLIEQMRRDLDRAHEEIQLIKERIQGSDLNVREIMTEIRHVLEAIARLEGKIDRHLEEE